MGFNFRIVQRSKREKESGAVVSLPKGKECRRGYAGLLLSGHREGFHIICEKKWGTGTKLSRTLETAVATPETAKPHLCPRKRMDPPGDRGNPAAKKDGTSLGGREIGDYSHREKDIGLSPAATEMEFGGGGLGQGFEHSESR